MLRDQQQLHLRGNITLYQGNVSIVSSICLNYLVKKIRLKLAGSTWSFVDFLRFRNRPSVLYSDDRPQNTANIAEDLSKCVLGDNTQKMHQGSASVCANRVPQGNTWSCYEVDVTSYIVADLLLLHLNSSIQISIKKIAPSKFSPYFVTSRWHLIQQMYVVY